MTDENKTSHEQEPSEFDEFDDAFEEPFEEDAHATTTTAEPASAAESPSIQRPAPKSGSWLPLLIGLAIIGFLGWKLYGMFAPKTVSLPVSAARDESAEQSATLVEPPPPELATVQEPNIEAIPAPAPAPVPTPAPAPTPTATESPVVSNDIQKLLSKMNQQEKQYQEKITALEKEIVIMRDQSADATRRLSVAQNDLATLSRAIQELGNQVDILRVYQEREQIRQQQAKTKASSKPAKKTESVASDAGTSLVVYAIIPGRAWLRQSNGKTITVTEGDTVGEYGRVLKIDASNGIVITTSGAMLR